MSPEELRAKYGTCKECELPLTEAGCGYCYRVEMERWMAESAGVTEGESSVPSSGGPVMRRNVSPESVVSVILANYRQALRRVQESIDLLRSDLRECESEPDAPFTPGRLAGQVAQLEAARGRAATLRETLRTLGIDAQEVEASEGRQTTPG